jgi:hypothetical protein
MTQCHEPIDIARDLEHPVHTHEILYLVKRRRYEVALAVPRRHAIDWHEDQALVHVHLNDQDGMHGFVFTFEEMADFYESLSRCLEYVRAEQQKRSGTHHL